ncbi:type II toxin-antitoxin system RelE/ParE family toxin [Actinobacillus genomosp. 1]|uniref:type II toxin-antitoxin system RelE/ParE family toxin n=1 Tax=Actinobacillus genomosp. 1 TaxID=254839 RepID=UPI0024427921|nr:type II toxin-antitoxin system RelE/ParE family toxin [Actinobacillus genomosp. 1]WGE35601.1 type II toxin-antitoxin system RelE/ParE family toxin [Actinobacillus genomosp. 1]
MKLVFVELPPFERYRQKHLSDEEYKHFQNELLENPNKGDLIQGTNGLRKIRIADMQRNKGKRGGARVIYYHIVNYSKILLVTAYGKDEQSDLSNTERNMLANKVKRIVELEIRSCNGKTF